MKVRHSVWIAIALTLIAVTAGSTFLGDRETADARLKPLQWIESDVSVETFASLRTAWSEHGFSMVGLPGGFEVGPIALFESDDGAVWTRHDMLVALEPLEQIADLAVRDDLVLVLGFVDESDRAGVDHKYFVHTSTDRGDTWTTSLIPIEHPAPGFIEVQAFLTQPVVTAAAFAFVVEQFLRIEPEALFDELVQRGILGPEEHRQWLTLEFVRETSGGLELRGELANSNKFSLTAQELGLADMEAEFALSGTAHAIHHSTVDGEFEVIGLGGVPDLRLAESGTIFATVKTGETTELFTRTADGDESNGPIPGAPFELLNTWNGLVFGLIEGPGGTTIASSDDLGMSWNVNHFGPFPETAADTAMLWNFGVGPLGAVGQTVTDAGRTNIIFQPHDSPKIAIEPAMEAVALDGDMSFTIGDRSVVALLFAKTGTSVLVGTP